MLLDDLPPPDFLNKDFKPLETNGIQIESKVEKIKCRNKNVKRMKIVKTKTI